MSDPKTYTAADIERYHSGGLSAPERHALEKAALDDPFLADALEGYAFTQTPSADLNALQQKLQGRIEKKEKSRGVFYLNKGMKIAAMLLLIAGGGWIVFQLFNPKESNLATRQSPMAKPGLLNKRVSDSGTVSDAPLPMRPQIQPAAEQKAATEPEAAREKVAAHKAPATGVQVPDGAFNTPMPDSAKAEVYTNRNAAEVLQGRAAGITASKPTTDAATLNEERKDAAAYKKSAAAPFEKNSRLASPSTDTIKNFNVTLQRTELSPAETVQLNSKAKERLPAGKMGVIRIDSTEPAEGWTNFDDYIAGNLKEPEEIKTKGLAGEVELSFDVNKEGEAVNIAVTKSLCDKCDEEAVRLLKEGPKWKKNKKKGIVKIKFPPSP